MHPKSFVGRAPPEPAGELTALPRPLSGFKGATSKEREGGVGTGGKRWKGRRKETLGLPLHIIPGYATVAILNIFMMEIFVICIC